MLRGQFNFSAAPTITDRCMAANRSLKARRGAAKRSRRGHSVTETHAVTKWPSRIHCRLTTDSHLRRYPTRHLRFARPSSSKKHAAHLHCRLAAISTYVPGVAYLTTSHRFTSRYIGYAAYAFAAASANHARRHR